jgi:hypothetical protein
MKTKLLTAFALAAAMTITSGAAPAGPLAGQKTEEGTVYAGVSPRDSQGLFTTAADAPGIFMLKDAVNYCG